MNSRCAAMVCLFLAVGAVFKAEAKGVRWSKLLGADETLCLAELLSSSHWAGVSSQEIQALVGAAEISRVHLGNQHADYIFLFNDIGWCGTAGCALLIGERSNHTCHILYDGYGWYTVTILARRDHGYHRLDLPCEVRFEGKQYRQLHPDCPNLDVQR